MSCVDTLGPGNTLCNSDHCNEFQETTNFHAICLCIDWQGHTIPDCNPKNSNYPVQTGQCYNPNTGAIQNTTSQACTALGAPWYFQTCYCCCTCFAANTPIAIPTGTMAIGDVQINDTVLAAAAGAGGTWTWSPQMVTFSSGAPATSSTDPTAGNIMIYMAFGDQQALILSRDQLVMLPDGKLKRADQLVPGIDQLVAAADAVPLPIHQLASGYYKGAVHHIATATPSYTDWDGSIDTHLINANGIIGGDYLLQMYQDTDKMKPHLADPDAPDLGSPDYHAAAPMLMVKPFVVGKQMVAAGVEVTTPGFRVHAASEAVIPSGAFQLFTARQEALLMGPTIPKRGFSDVTNVQLTNYYAKVYGAFYPAIDVYLDWESIHPNVYAFKQYGRHIVVVGGEFLRLGPLYGPAMAMAISFGVANGALEGNAAELGHSIYDGIGIIMQQVFQGGSTIGELQQGGQAQFTTLLALLDTAEAGDSGDIGDGLSAACMISTIDAAISGDPLPACAGGPPTPTLALTSADYADGQLTISFSEPVDAAGATEVSHYHVTPDGDITAVTMVEGVGTQVVASVALKPGSYSVTASRIQAVDGSPLDPAHSSAAFAVAEPSGIPSAMSSKV